MQVVAEWVVLCSQSCSQCVHVFTFVGWVGVFLGVHSVFWWWVVLVVADGFLRYAEGDFVVFGRPVAPGDGIRWCPARPDLGGCVAAADSAGAAVEHSGCPRIDRPPG